MARFFLGELEFPRQFSDQLTEADRLDDPWRENSIRWWQNVENINRRQSIRRSLLSVSVDLLNFVFHIESIENFDA